MEKTSLEKLLDDALELCAQEFPDSKKRLDAFNNAAENLFEKDENGNLTRCAYDARARFRSPLLDMRPYQRAKKEVGKQRRKSKAKAETAIMHALAALTLYKQWELEYDLLNEKDDATTLVPKNREEHNREGIFKIVEPFIYDLINRGVSPSAISLRRQSEMDVLAALIKSSHEDPKFEDPNNPWPVLARTGFYGRYTADLSEDEAHAIDLAWRMRDESAAILLAKARDFLPRDLMVSTDLAMGAVRLNEAHGRLPDGLAHLYADAFKLVRNEDIVALGKLFQWEKEEDLIKLHVLVNFIRRQDIPGRKETPAWIEMDIVTRLIDSSDAATKPPVDWVPGVIEKLAQLAENLSPSLNCEEAFYAIVRAGTKLSGTYERFERDADIRASKERELLRLRTMRDCIEQGLDFKIDQFGYPVTEKDDDFDRLETKAYQVAIRQPAIEHRPNENTLQDEDGDRVYTAEQSDGSPPDFPAEMDANGDVDLFETRHGHEHGHPDGDDDEGEEVDFYAVAGIDRNQSEPEDDDLEEPLSDVSPDGELGTEPDPIKDAQTNWSAVADPPIAPARTLFSENELATERTSSPPREHANDTRPSGVFGPMEGGQEHPADIAINPHLGADGLSEDDQSNTPHPTKDERPDRLLRFDRQSLSDFEDKDML